MEWIKVSDRLPFKGDLVDVYTNYHGRCTDYEYEGKGTFYNNDIDDTKEIDFSDTQKDANVSYWMYTPDIPKDID